MGGYGSTRWGWHSKRLTVQDCAVLDATRWTSQGILAPGGCWVGNAVGQFMHVGVRAGSLRYEVDTTDCREPWVRLYYTLTGTNQCLDYKVGLTTTRPTFGGLCWWFVCPLVKNL